VAIWLSHPASYGHVIPGHPERPERLVALEGMLEANDWFGWDRVRSRHATRAQLEAVHTGALIDAVESLCAAGGGAIDMDTACVEATWSAALHSAGGAIELCDALLSGEHTAGFSAHRPPGHHAEPGQAMGFCFFDSVAVGAAHALASGAERVLILDWDVHHGNGTNAIFHASRDVLFASIHQSPLYPGTGPASDVGSGAGEGYTVNLPVPPGTGDAGYCSLVEHVIVPLARTFQPSLLLVSAGFDAHHRDPLASCRVTEAGYAGMTASLKRVCAELGIGLGLVLEGGYSVEALADSVEALMPVLGGDAPAAQDVARDPLSEAAIARLERYFGLTCFA
jgi:acetoin utilization deacetylase AcuC-like enzyme